MNNPRANIANLIAAGGGAVLILSLFISWFGSGDESRSAFGIFSFADIVLFLIGLVTLALAGAHVAGQAGSLPGFLRPSLLKWLGIAALSITLLFSIEFTSGDFGADLKIGAILAVLASAAILAGGILNDRPDLAARLNEATSGIGSGGGDQPGGGQPGVGAGAQAPGGYGAGQPGGGAAAAPSPAPSAQPQQPQSPPQQAEQQTAAQPVQSPSPAAQPAQQESSGPAPGWYPDPQGQKRLRYWDGGRWTEQTAD